MSPATKPSPDLPASGSSLNDEGYHTCARCPVCGTEECKMLEQLGMYCTTKCAASSSEAAGRDVRKTRRRAISSRAS